MNPSGRLQSCTNASLIKAYNAFIIGKVIVWQSTQFVWKVRGGPGERARDVPEPWQPAGRPRLPGLGWSGRVGCQAAGACGRTEKRSCIAAPAIYGHLENAAEAGGLIRLLNL